MLKYVVDFVFVLALGLYITKKHVSFVLTLYASHVLFQVLSVWQNSDSGVIPLMVDQEQLTWNQRNMSVNFISFKS